MVKKSSKDPHRKRESKKYTNPIASREHILSALRDISVPLKINDIAKNLDINSPRDQEALRRRLRAMVRDGQVKQVGREKYSVILDEECFRGHVLAHKDGFGFVELEAGGDDVFLSAREMRSLFNQDEVLVRITGLDRRGRQEGSLVKVLTRNTQQLAGHLKKDQGRYFVEPDGPRMTQPIYIDKEDLNGASLNQIVVVGITEYPTASHYAMGKVGEVLGEHMAPGMEIELSMRSHGIPNEWPEEALKEADSLGDVVRKSDLKGRKDLRELAFVTIDGEDAKDFDDAVYCEAREQGGFRLMVAIADVSHYVKPASALDKEAKNRGNSVYFPEQVIPMLPEVLSNGLCSLKPEVDRLALVCDMTLDEKGKVTRSSFYEAVIHSHARMTYTKVASLLSGDKEFFKTYEALMPRLYDLKALFDVLTKARKKRGAIEFESTETRIVFGKDRKIEKIVPVVRNDAHRIIEECMLAANVSTALYLIKHKANALFRVHHGPSGDKLDDLRGSLRELGLSLEGNAEIKPGDYARLLESVGDRPDRHVIQTLLLRSLSQAVYSPDEAGHFGLAYDHYTHFTSPIRRYPDLLIHRLIKMVLKKETMTENEGLQALGEHCSMTERRADEATWDAIDWLKCEYMMDRLGEEFKGTISGVTGFGLFIELNDIYVEGLAHITTMNGFYEFDSARHQLKSPNTRQCYKLGQQVKVQVARVSLDDRKIDFVLV